MAYQSVEVISLEVFSGSGVLMELPKDVVYMMNCIPKKSTKRLINLTDERLGHLGLKAYHTIVMSVIAYEPGSSQKHIMENTPFNKARVSIIVSELMDRGYVVDTSEGKSSSLCLTEEGKQIFDVAEQIFMDHHATMLSVFSPEEAKEFHKMLMKLNKRLDEMLLGD